MKTKDYGPAFPVQSVIGSAGQTLSGSPGMSLRDYFAAMAMQGEISRIRTGTVLISELSEWSYKMADAMLAERHK